MSANAIYPAIVIQTAAQFPTVGNWAVSVILVPLGVGNPSSAAPVRIGVGQPTAAPGRAGESWHFAPTS